MLLAFDTETTGLDLFKGCLPFYASFYNGKELFFYEWEVNPQNRNVRVNKQDLKEMEDLFQAADIIVGHNIKFDITAIKRVGLKWKKEWFKKTEDTGLVAHSLDSMQELALDSLVSRYLGVDLNKQERDIDAAAKKAQTLADKLGWKRAKNKSEDMPSQKKQAYKADMWLPKTLCKFARENKGKYSFLREYESEKHLWNKVLEDYAVTDALTTYKLWEHFTALFVDNPELEIVYRDCRKPLIEIIHNMEWNGISVIKKPLEYLQNKFKENIEENLAICKNLSNDSITELPKSGSTKEIKNLCFDSWGLPPVKVSEKTGEPSMDKSVLASWLNLLDIRSIPYAFIDSFSKHRKSSSLLTQISAYPKFGEEEETSYKIHSSINPTGTHTLRMTSANPSEQTISKDVDEEDGTSIRSAFGPKAGREWWSSDYENLELKIPAYKAGEKAMIELFERPNEAPYFGSQHLLVSHILYPKQFEECLAQGKSFKKEYKGTLYQWVKNGNFAVQYGAMEESGTADAAYRLKGAQSIIKSRFTNIEVLNQSLIEFANENGFVQTELDRDLNCRYTLSVRKRYGRVMPTLPLNYYVQGTAMWCMCKAMNRVFRCFEKINTKYNLDCFITMQVHDEMVFDLPQDSVRRKGPNNLEIMREVASLMKKSGEDICIPLTVDVSLHRETWAKDDLKTLGITI